MPSAKSNPQELRALLDACRGLMRTLLTLSQERRTPDWSGYLRTARDLVVEARRCVRNHERADGSIEDVERLADSMARIYVRDLLGEEGGKDHAPAQALPAWDGLRGYTSAFPVPDVLSFLQVQAKTGTLRVNTGSEVISLVLVEGDLVHAYSDNQPPGLRLGEILVERGHLELADLQRVVVALSSREERLGDALLKLGLIGPKALEEALELQIRLIFVRLLGSRRAYFSFHVGAADEPPLSRFNVTGLLLDAARIQDEEVDGAA